MGGQDEAGRRVYRKLSAGEQARFLEVLGETGNRRAAAAAIGVEPRLMDQRREHDPALDRAWDAAAEAAHRRLSGAEGPFDPSRLGAGPATGRGTGRAEGGGLTMIRRGKKGRLQLVAGGEGRWNAEVEERFKAALRKSGNVRAAARAVGFSESAVWERRRKWPAFARALEEMLEEAELALEFRIACMGGNVVGVESACDRPSASPSPEGRGEVPFDPDFAMRFLKWREEKRRGRGRWAPRATPPSIEEVTETIVRRVEAIKRHRSRKTKA